jgi:uncharacterized protein YjbI with pentapeptide repeats
MTPPDVHGGSWVNADLRGKDFMDGRFSSCDFRGADLESACLDRSTFMDCDFRGAMLDSGRAPGATFTRVRFDGARFHHVDFGGCRFEGGTIEEAEMYHAIFRDAVLDGVSMKSTRVSFSQFEGIKINSKANLNGIVFEKTPLVGARLEVVDLAESSFRSVDLRNTLWREVNLDLSSFYDVDCDGAELENCHVFGMRICCVRGTPSRQRRITCSALGQPPLLIEDFKLAPFIHELDRDEATGRLIETLATKLVLLLGRFKAGPKELLDRLFAAFRRRGYIPAIIDFKCAGSHSWDEVMLSVAMCAHFVVVDMTDAHAAFAEVPYILASRAVPIKPLIAIGAAEPSQFGGLRRRFAHLLPLFTYDSPESLIDNIDAAVIAPCEAELERLRQQPI